MTAYKDRPFSHRLGAMGDEAEGRYVEEYPTAHRTGLNRPEFGLKSLTDFQRHIPDFLDANGFCEVIGCGPDCLVKFRFDKIISLSKWGMDGSVDVYVWHSTRKKKSRAAWGDWLTVISKKATWGHFPDNGMAYAAVHVDDAPGEWTAP